LEDNSCPKCMPGWSLQNDILVHFAMQNRYAWSNALCVGLNLTD
jgi:hypothetical protein